MIRALPLLVMLAACGEPKSDRGGPPATDAAVEADACVDGAGRCGEGLEVCASGEWTVVGECPAGAVCYGGACLPADCAGDCGQRECGCNGLCGVCADGWVCGDEGRCRIPGSRCGDGECLEDEGCGRCPTDCACPAGELCNPSNGECTACARQCGGRVCGDDGCGGNCGECDGRCNGNGTRCLPCDRECAGRECGADGCGGVCGTCEAPAQCSRDARCVTECVPDCPPGACAEDGCGGMCGDCAVGETCEAGRCASTPTVCGDRVCAGDETCRSCQVDCGVCCGNGVCQPELDEGCVSCARDCMCGAHERCVEAQDRCVVVCAPQCAGKACGSDGCGGECGQCEAGLTCEEPAGRCR